MKRNRRMVAILLVLLLLTGMMPCSAYINASDWAQPELEQAETLGLLSAELLAADQTQSISRLSFSAHAVRLWETIAGRAAPSAQAGVFSDCSEQEGMKAVALGIVNGVEPGVFAPDWPVRRQDMAVMLYRALAALDWTPADTDAALFEDDGEIDPYAKPAVYRLRALGILNGDDRNRLHPGEPITNEQAAALLLRTYQIVTGAEAEETAKIRINGYTAWLSMPEEKLLTVFGPPDETLATGNGMEWYLFGTETYETFFVSGITDGAVTALYAASGTFSYCGQSRGDSAAEGLPAAHERTTEYLSPREYAVTRYYDSGNEDSLYAVFLRNAGSRNRITAASGLTEPERVSLHLVNAFRAGYGKPLLAESPEAAQVAQRHSADMADRMMLSHIGADGSTLAGRMTAYGLSWSAVGENIGRNSTGDLLALHHSWVNSSTHRANLVNEAFTLFGAASAYNGAYYFTQEYVAPVR